ncbi:hypothetical protein [Arthrobacter rhizosphaerae]|uniref:hypothetical protein n=1 Tax=Arthrobacter rhizosphaerae TaxID=2855490 RepID=UPI001FF21983|nr:hypothetical protein [Arthrobacter rhizosphaerae]
MANTTFILCECCTLVLANDDESGCRDFHGHKHAPLDVPPGTAISQGPHTWNGSLELTCHGHEKGLIQPGENFWLAELQTEQPARTSPLEGATHD